MRNDKQLSQGQRYQIEILLKEGYEQKKIATTARNSRGMRKSRSPWRSRDFLKGDDVVFGKGQQSVIGKRTNPPIKIGNSDILTDVTHRAICM